MKTDKTNINRIPKLRVSDQKKRANNFAHTKAIIDYYIGCSYFVEEAWTPTTEARDIRILYEAYNNRLPETFFHTVVNPLNSSNQEYTNWPARVRSYSIIRPNIDLLEGEYEKRPFSFTIKVNNQDAVNFYQEDQYLKILRALEQQFINMMNTNGAQTGVPTQEVEPPEKIKALYASNYIDKRAEVGEAALNVIMDDLRVEHLFKKLFHDWLVAGECYTYKGVRGGEMVYERVSPLDIDFDKSPDTEYVEDGQWVVRRLFMTPADIYDKFYNELSEADIDLIEDESGDMSFRTLGAGSWDALRTDEDLRRNKIPVYHVVFKYLTKLGILTYINPITGEEEEIEVPDTYKPTEGESVEWFWTTESWEGYRVMDELYDFYLGIQPVPNQRNSLTSLSGCKLPYNGRRFSDTHSQNISVVELGLPYEILHRILHFNLEKTIAKSKGKIVFIDQGALPKKFGWDEEKFFYWADATGWALLDRSQPGADKSFNQYTSVDLSLFDHIAELIKIMDAVKMEWDEVLGITRQRKGDVKTSETATGAQASIFQSTVISERLFSKFEEFIEYELRGLLDTSKLVWIDGFKRLYRGDDLRNIILEVDPKMYTEASLGVYVSKSARDIQNLEMVRQRIQEFAQNGLSPSSVIDIIQARSLSKLRNLIAESEQKMMENQQQAATREEEAQERLLMIEKSFKELEGFIEERLLHVQYDREEDLELLKQTGQDQNPLPIVDPANMQKVTEDARNKEADRALKERTERVKARQKDRELDLKAQELKVRERIADKQAKVALKNKVSGEK